MTTRPGTQTEGDSHARGQEIALWVITALATTGTFTLGAATMIFEMSPVPFVGACFISSVIWVATLLHSHENHEAERDRQRDAEWLKVATGLKDEIKNGQIDRLAAVVQRAEERSMGGFGAPPRLRGL
jgi:hypothetical protein